MPNSAAANSTLSRRDLIGLAACTPLALAAIASAASAQTAQVCVNLDTLSLSQKGMRRSIGFKVQSTDPKKQCGGCAFFKGTTGACGTCQLLTGGAVFTTSVCDNWAAKA